MTRKILARAGERVRVTFEGVTLGDLHESDDTLHVSAGMRRQVYVECADQECLTIELITEPVIAGRVYEDTEGSVGIVREEDGELFLYYGLLGGRAPLKGLRADLLPLRQVYPSLT